MLQKIRDKASGALVIFMLGLLILAFAVWGIDFQGGANANVLEVNGEEIPAYRVVNAYNQQVQNLQQYYPDGIPDLQQERIKDSVMESFVRSELLTQHAREAGFGASDQSVWDGIRSSPNFQIDGQFNLDQFKFLAASNNFSADGLFNEFRKSRIIEQVAKGLSDSAFVTSAEITQRGKLERENRTYRSMTLKAGSLLPEVTTDDAMIQAEYDLNQSDYFTEESVRVNYIEIDPTKISENIEVTEDALRERYETGLGNNEFDQEQTRKARHILIAESDRSEDEARSLAADLRARVLAGEDFAELASEYSDDAGSKILGGELDWSARDAFVGPFSDALFSMVDGDVSEPIKSRYGYHVIRLEGVRGDAVKPFEEVRNSLTASLKSNLVLDELNNIISDVDDAAYDSDENLTVAAEIAGVEVQESPWFSRLGGSGIAVNADNRSVAFSGQILTDKLNSNSIKVDDKYYYLHLNEYRPSVQMPIDEVRARIRSKLAFELTCWLRR